MNPMTWPRPRRPTARHQRSTRLAVESIEQRLAPSTFLSLPPSHATSPVEISPATGKRQDFAPYAWPPGGAGLAALHEPPDPC